MGLVLELSEGLIVDLGVVESEHILCREAMTVKQKMHGRGSWNGFVVRRYVA